MKKRVYFDMDNVIVDFKSALDKIDEATKKEYKDHLDDIPGLFGLMEPMPGAIEALHHIAKEYDCYILSTAPWANPSAWADKVLWVTTHLDDIFHKRLIISHHKELIRGEYLVDDRPKNGASEFQGKWIQFGSPEFPDWATIEDYFCRKMMKYKVVEDGHVSYTNDYQQAVEGFGWSICQAKEGWCTHDFSCEIFDNTTGELMHREEYKSPWKQNGDSETPQQK